MTAATVDLRGARPFRLLWFGQTVSLAGTQVSRIALPLVAIVTLHAGPLAVSAVSAFTTLPFLVFGLVAGAWVDRTSRRRILIASDIGRAIAMLSMPVVLVLGHAGGLAWLFVEASVVGTLTVFFDVACDAYVVSLVPTDQLERANGRLSLSDTLSRFVGPGAGGALVQLMGAPLAVVADGLSYLVSVASLVAIPSVEADPPAARERLRDQLRDGLRLVARVPPIRALLVTGATLNLFDAAVSALLLLFLTRTVGMSAGAVGLAFAIGSVGGLVAISGVQGLRTRIGPRAAMVVGLGCVVAARLTQASLVAGRPAVTFGLLVAAQAIAGYGAVTFNVVQVSLRQRLTPNRLLGRMTATIRMVSWGVIPIGATAGGLLAQWWGVRPSVAAFACGTILAPLALLAMLRARPNEGGAAGSGAASAAGAAQPVAEV
jgi:MFS family permease